MSFGELSGLPSKRSAITLIVPSYPARVVLAGQEPPLAVARVAVAVVRGLAEHAHGARLLVPAHHAVVRDVAPQEVAPVAEPHRPLVPAAVRGDALHLRQPELVAVEARIDHLDRRIRVAAARLPSRRRLRQRARP